ncbi:hypothetical protein [Reichenbachiella versicolor]|uniref:hypothetical protein n=1 Tax=Reichenbachiella versicolor TaxID=1821036 RepID=UPI0013A56EE8|nr:hypothetical protein [Reichenbachiella versicolor]
MTGSSYVPIDVTVISEGLIARAFNPIRDLKVRGCNSEEIPDSFPSLPREYLQRWRCMIPDHFTLLEVFSKCSLSHLFGQVIVNGNLMTVLIDRLGVTSSTD